MRAFRSAGHRSLLLIGTSGSALAMMLGSAPAHAQLANLGGALGHTVNVPVPVAVGSAAAPSLTPTQAQIAARHASYKARVSQQADIVANANAAARAAAAAIQQNISNGLAANGLKPVDLARQNSSALTVWVGADQPTQTNLTTPVNGATVQVDVKQTQDRALLSWDSFNVGRETLLNFNQQGHSDWVVVNRIVGGIDPATGRLDPARNPSPTQILGQIKAEGTVYILDRSGVLFGANSQVNLHSLVASTLELGRTVTRNPKANEAGQPALLDVSLDTLNSTYLQNGILPGTHVGLLGSISGETHGEVKVAAGAQIRSTGGFVILAAPKVSMAGEINPAKAPDGTSITQPLGAQVSLVAGNYVDASTSSGSADSLDPSVRGLILVSQGGGTVDVSGSISAPQGYISLVTDSTGTINLSGILSSTTSVSRNGKISLIGGAINLLSRPIEDFNGDILRGNNGQTFESTATLAITADLSGATIPQAADSVAGFKTSQIDFGNYDVELTGIGLAMLQTRSTETPGQFLPTLLPSLVSIGANSTIYAPGGDVNIGGRAGGAHYVASSFPMIGKTGVTIGDNAVIDVSGLDSVSIAATRNQLVISPAKKNELRDTPVYRDPATGAEFTLNGATLYVDPRLSGVRDDGVAWVGSPLLEAGSLADQIGVTAEELLTKGGNVTLATMEMDDKTLGVLPKPSVDIAKTATIDFSGGWVSYQAGQIRTSTLITADGRVVDIGSADPNDTFIGVASGFVEVLPQLSAPRIYANSLVTPTHFEAGYSEGRDAGSLNISAPTAQFNANLFGTAVAGERQIIEAKAASAASTIVGDPRKLQAVHGELPSAGLLRFSTKLGGSIFVGGRDVTLPDGSAGLEVDGRQVAATPGLVHILDSTINSAHLSALVLESSGSATFAEGSDVELQPGGVFSVKAGRAISFNGSISVPAGAIDALTYGSRFGDLFDAGDDLNLSGISAGTTPAWRALVENGSGLADHPAGWFDLTVNSGALLSTRGLWTNDLLVTDGLYQGGAYTSGGSVSLAVAPHVMAFTDATRTKAVDLSGSLALEAGSLVDVSSGGFISRTGALDLSGRGGNVTLKDETAYFQLHQTDAAAQGQESGTSLFRSDLTTFQLTAVSGVGYDSAIVPDALNSRVNIADGTIRGFGFEGGGTFKLVTPDLDFGGRGDGGTVIPLDFLQKTGFATLDLSAWNTTFIDNVFDNGRTGKTALLSTELVKIRAGETLDLTQALLPSILNAGQIATLRGLASGQNVSRLADFTPGTSFGAFYDRAASLVLGGLTELDIEGGTVRGAAGASITVPKLYQGGTISIHGGTITQSELLPTSYGTTNAAIGVGQQADGNPVDLTGALAAVFGEADEDGHYSETALSADPRYATIRNRDLISKANSDHQIYYLGRLAQNDGIVFASGSTTDLSGTVLLDPFAGSVNGVQQRIGRLVDGGSINALGRYTKESDLFSASVLGEAGFSYSLNSVSPYTPLGVRPARAIQAEANSRIDISGAQGIFDIRVSGNSPSPVTVWSNGGTLSAMGGGDVSRATISAAGGAPGAAGGTFDWYNPVLRQNATSAIPAGASPLGNIVFADQLMGSGFDRLIARGTLTTLGDVDLKLGRAFILKSADSLGTVEQLNYYSTTITGTGDLSITAPHIVLSSILQAISSLPEWKAERQGRSSLTLRAEAASGTGASFDIIGAVGIDAGFDEVKLSSQGDIRLIGVQPIKLTLNPQTTVKAPSLSGGLVAVGRLDLQAREIYATTGTGNLLSDPTAQESDTFTGPFQIASLAKGSAAQPTVAFRTEPGTTPSTPYSAGGYIQVLGENILQAGVLYAPIGRIDLGSRTGLSPQGLIGLGDLDPTIVTKTLTLAAGSITSVSGGDLSIPFGTTTDLTDAYFLATLKAPLDRLPAAQLGLSAGDIVTDAGATVDASGGGKLYAYEFVSGTGGSRDVLSRFNSDPYSGNDGFLFPDQRQVYAILPASSAAAAAFYDPIYSSDYASLYGGEVGKTVHLDAVPESAPGKGDGVAAGDYILLPAKYALLPGAMRLVEDGTSANLVGASSREIDGSIHVGGSYGVAGTAITDATRRSFTVQSQEVFRRYSQIVTTDTAQKIEARALQNNIVIPRLPNDAAKIVIDPGTGLTIGNRFETSAKTSPAGKAGRGSQVDILGSVLSIVSSSDNAAPKGVSIVADTLANLGAASLMIGGTRTDMADGSTQVTVTASEIHVRNYGKGAQAAGVIALSAPELILAVNGPNSVLDIADNAQLTATGPLVDNRDGLYDLSIPEFVTSDDDRRTSVGSFLRLANGPERFVSRTGNLAYAGTRDKSAFDVGKASLSGQSLLMETSLNLDIATEANLAVDKLALGSDLISFSTRDKGMAGFVISPELEAKLAAIGQLTLISPTAIGFTPGLSGADHKFKSLVIDAPGIRLIRPTTSKADQSAVSVVINADTVSLRNRFTDTGSCVKTGVLACSSTASSLAIHATGSLTLGSGTFRTYGFESKVTATDVQSAKVSLSALGGVYYSGRGSLELADAALDLTTPFIADLGKEGVPTEKSEQADYAVNTVNAVKISAPAGSTVAIPATPLAPGARFVIGSLTSPAGSLQKGDGTLVNPASLTITDTVIRATAGSIALFAQNDIALAGTAQLQTPSYKRTFGADGDPDQVTVSANGGSVDLITKTGNIRVDAGTRIAIGGASGKNGSLSLIASQGTIALNGTIDAAAPSAGGSFAFDSGKSGFDFAAFVGRYGSQFTGDVAIRSGQGDLALDTGTAYKLGSLKLVADGGAVSINRRIDTSGINGGAITLYGQTNVTLGASAELVSRSTGYELTDTRQARAGDITIGTGDSGSIAVASGARLDLGVAHADARLVSKSQIDPNTLNPTTSYTLVDGDLGGTLTLRAPVIEQDGADTVNVSFAGTVQGAQSVSLVGYKRYDLEALAANPDFTGISIVDGVATLDPSAAGKNILTDEKSPNAIPYFIQNFDISGANSKLGGLTALGDLFHERAGIDLDYSGDIRLDKAWNLAAGYITDYAAASSGANPDLVLSPLSLIEGKPVYSVVEGQEAHLFQNYVHMLYRTGTGANAAGEAGVFTFRAGGDLDIGASISDGFFNFADQTDQTYMQYRMGGGKLLVQPVYDIVCGAAGCENLADFTPGTQLRPTTSVNIVLSGTDRGQLVEVAAPYSDSANSASPASLGTDNGGDPLGGASLFPLLADGSAVSSSDIRLVGGAGKTRSVDPLHIDRASNGSVIVEGQTSYTLSTPARTVSYTGDALIRGGISDTTFDPSALSDDFMVSQVGLSNDETLRRKATRITFGRASAESNLLLIAAAREFVKNHPGEAQLIGGEKAPTGIATSLGLAMDFLNESKAYELLGEALDGDAMTAKPVYEGTTRFNRETTKQTATVRTVVRTGTGSINIAAAKDVDLTNGDPILRNEYNKAVDGANTDLYQVGGTAVYTAGHRVNPVAVTATVVGTGQTLTVDPAAYLPARTSYDLAYDPVYVDGFGRRAAQLQADAVFAKGGGSIGVEAGNDVLGRRDVQRDMTTLDSPVSGMVGAAGQAWRVGELGSASDDVLGSTYIRINPNQFRSGIGALGGGDVSINAGHNLSEMTVALDTTLATAEIGDSFGAMVFGGGNLDVKVGGTVDGGRFDVASGVADISAGEDIGGLGYLRNIPNQGQETSVVRRQTVLRNLLDVRLTDTQMTMRAGGSITLGSVAALGLDKTGLNSQGFYTGNSALVAQSGGDFRITGGGVPTGDGLTRVLPATFDVVSYSGDIDLGASANFLYPGARGQLSLLAAGTLRANAIDLDDGDPSYLPGLYSAFRTEQGPSGPILEQGRNFFMPGVFANTLDAQRRLQHNASPTHAGDTTPARIMVGGSLANLSVYSAKQMRISAEQDILNLIFVGQNVSDTDVTRIRAGRDIAATNAITSGGLMTSDRKVLQGNYIALSGPGSLFVEAGRDMGPFLNSATVESYLLQTRLGDTFVTQPVKATGSDSYAGGILAVGNDFNPWLAPKSADIYVSFGVAKGADYATLRETYLNPDNLDDLPGDLFEQNVDSFGNKTPDRTRPIYSPKLIAYMKANAADALMVAYGTTDVSFAQAYEAFAALPALQQRRFLLDNVYFAELAAPSDPNGNSYQQYVRGYRAVDALFGERLGYTANDLSGASNGGAQVATGNLDLRLAAIETTRGGNVTILGPGGNAILGSVVRTSAQAAGLAYQPQILGADYTSGRRPVPSAFNLQVQSIPIGYEGVLTLRGGAIHSFTDGDLRLNQSRLFTQQSGNIVLWSSNGDLNAGQGPKSAANVPPIVLRFGPNGGSEVDSAGAVVGAGIAGFTGIRRQNLATGTFDLVNILEDPDVAAASAQLAAPGAAQTVTINGKIYSRDVPAIYLLAPAGTVDAGDAGVRAGGDIFVAAAQVANSDNFKVGGSAIGIPSLATPAAPALPASAAAALTANLFNANTSGATDQPSRIFVDVLGYFNSNGSSDSDCLDEEGKPAPAETCSTPPPANRVSQQLGKDRVQPVG